MMPWRRVKFFILTLFNSEFKLTYECQNRIWNPMKFTVWENVFKKLIFRFHEKRLDYKIHLITVIWFTISDRVSQRWKKHCPKNIIIGRVEFNCYFSTRSSVWIQILLQTSFISVYFWWHWGILFHSTRMVWKILGITPTSQFPYNNHKSFMSEHVVCPCSCCRTVVVTTFCYCFHVLICENGKKLRFEQWLSTP